MYNCSGYALTDERRNCVDIMNTDIQFFPPNATDLLQPADAFLIQK